MKRIFWFGRWMRLRCYFSMIPFCLIWKCDDDDVSAKLNDDGRFDLSCSLTFQQPLQSSEWPPFGLSKVRPCGNWTNLVALFSCVLQTGFGSLENDHHHFVSLILKIQTMVPMPMIKNNCYTFSQKFDNLDSLTLANDAIFAASFLASTTLRISFSWFNCLSASWIDSIWLSSAWNLKWSTAGTRS